MPATHPMAEKLCWLNSGRKEGSRIFATFTGKIAFMQRFAVNSYSELVTSHAQTKAGFIEAALTKNERAKPYIEQAKSLRTYARQVDDPHRLLAIPQIRDALITASGLSDKALKYFDAEDKTEAINKLIETFLVPAGERFADELVYRFLIVRGDSLGGGMRNYVGSIAQIKLIRKILSVLELRSLNYNILTTKNKTKNRWQAKNYENDYRMAEDIAAIAWTSTNGPRVLFFNAKIPLVNNNIDICLFEGTCESYAGGAIAAVSEKAIMLGELKGGIDPAGADEHWKTGNAALNRIRAAYGRSGLSVRTSFVAAAIENKMAGEIWEQLMDGTLDNAANITVDAQLTMYCNWLIEL